MMWVLKRGFKATWPSECSFEWCDFYGKIYLNFGSFLKNVFLKLFDMHTLKNL